MSLTIDQTQSLDAGRAVGIDVDGRDCIVILRTVYDRVRCVLEEQHDEESPRATYAAVLKAWDQDDENPQQYLEYLK